MRRTELAFLVMSTILSAGGARFRPGLRRLAFELPDVDERWSFDPRRERLFAEVPVHEPALSLRLDSSVLLRLAMGSEFRVEPTETFSYVGDIEALGALASACVPASGMLALRSQEASVPPTKPRRASAERSRR